MGIELPTAKPRDERTCYMCGRHPLASDHWFGPNMWWTWEFTCRHQTVYSCPECERLNPGRFAACGQCGCGEVYC